MRGRRGGHERGGDGPSRDEPAGDELAGALRRAGVSGVDDSALARSMYSSDASLYRVPPRVVVTPREADELPAVLEVCREFGAPLTMRGGGTSIAGNAVGPGVVVDVSRHLNRVLEIDPEAGTALVEPGIVQARLHQVAAEHGLRFGPDPSTRTRATLGGMIGNNACGSRALGYGRTSDNVLGLDVVTGTGERLRLGDVPGGGGGSALLERLRSLVAGDLALIRTEFGRFGRQVSGYSLEHLLPEKGFDVARALVGSEGTLALTLAARVRMVREPEHRLLAVLGFGSMAEAADAVPAILPHGPVACEGLDSRITGVVRERRGPGAVPPLPRGSGWLLVELAGPELGALREAARAVARDSGCADSAVVEDTALADALWRIREDGSGLVARTPEGEQAHAGWEDAAVPPERLGAYLREFEALLAEHGLYGVPYGHFGDGCIHVRIDFPFGRPDGRRVFRGFLGEAAALAARHDGTMSGEHGDGRARGELLPHMYSAEALALCARVKDVFDPDDVLNPGIIVRPAPVDDDLRPVRAVPYKRDLGFAYRDDRGDLSRAVHRCTGVGKCRADNTGAGGVMCPSYLATREEKDSTRGRARVLQEVVSGGLGPDGWRSAAVHDVLDLCLACKGCAADCPTGVDMATYKAEVLHQSYRGRLRPLSHYSMGWLPRWSRLAALAPRAVNRLLGIPPVAAAVKRVGGIDPRRPLPRFAERPFRRSLRRARGRRAGVVAGDGPPVLLWVDSFTDHFAPQVAHAAIRLLAGAGFAVRVLDRPVCCGLTWISTGQLDAARRILGRAVAALARYARDGVPIVALEPSCAAVLRSDAAELLDGPIPAVATLAEFLSGLPGWTPPDLSGLTVVAQPHCHHHAVLGWETDRALLARTGAAVRAVGGCCGLAGNFGMERGHYDVSVAVAETQLLPAIREAGEDAMVLADGFSCRTQISQLAGVRAVHLAELLADGRAAAAPRPAR